MTYQCKRLRARSVTASGAPPSPPPRCLRLSWPRSKVADPRRSHQASRRVMSFEQEKLRMRNFNVSVSQTNWCAKFAQNLICKFAALCTGKAVDYFFSGLLCEKSDEVPADVRRRLRLLDGQGTVCLPFLQSDFGAACDCRVQ